MSGKGRGKLGRWLANLPPHHTQADQSDLFNRRLLINARGDISPWLAAIHRDVERNSCQGQSDVKWNVIHQEKPSGLFPHWSVNVKMPSTSDQTAAVAASTLMTSSSSHFCRDFLTWCNRSLSYLRKSCWLVMESTAVLRQIWKRRLLKFGKSDEPEQKSEPLCKVTPS